MIEHHPIECTCSELIIANKNGFISVSIDLQNLLTTFFYEIAITLSKALRKCENIILMGDLNIDTKCKDTRPDKLEEFCDVFNLKNLVKSETNFTKDRKSLIDLILKNKSLSFQRTRLTESILNEYHKLL